MKISIWVVLSFSLMLAACGQQQKLPISAATAKTSDSTLTDSQKSDFWMQIPKEGEIAEGPLQGTRAYTIDQKTNSVLFEMPLFGGKNSSKTAIKGIPGGTFEVLNKTARVNIPLQYLSTNSIQPQGNVSLIDPTKLPNGDPLPGIPGGELPKIAAGPINVRDGVDLYIYLASKYVGVFAETKNVNPYVKMTFPIKDLGQTQIVGYFSTVPAKGNFPGGFWLSMVIPPELQRLIEDMIN